MDQNPKTQEYLTISLFSCLIINVIFVDITILKFLNMACFLMPSCIATHWSLLPGILSTIATHFSVKSAQRAYSLNPPFIFSTPWSWQNNPLFFSANNWIFICPSSFNAISWKLYNFSYSFQIHTLHLPHCSDSSILPSLVTLNLFCKFLATTIISQPLTSLFLHFLLVQAFLHALDRVVFPKMHFWSCISSKYFSKIHGCFTMWHIVLSLSIYYTVYSLHSNTPNFLQFCKCLW